MAERAAQLLNTQAMNLDVHDVLRTLPPEWPLHVLSSLLARSFRRTLHAHHEAQLVKALAASENRAVVERTWLVLREEGAVVEEADDDDDGPDGEEKVGEKEQLGLGLSEKVGLHVAQEDADGVVDLT